MNSTFHLKPYLDAQVREIEKYKWIESERRGHDIGFTQAAMEWIERFGSGFRNSWASETREKAA